MLCYLAASFKEDCEFDAELGTMAIEYCECILDSNDAL
jgi:hypothetical protein